MKPFSCFLSLLFVVSVFGQTTPLLTVVSVTAGDYYAEVTVKMSQNGVIYVYPLPTEVEVAPEDSTIVTYGFSANVTAGTNHVIYVEELEAKSSYNLYVTGRGVSNEVSSPSRIVKVVTTLSPTPPVLTISGFTAEKESIILRYSMTAAGTIWCRAYREEERDYASVEGVYSSIQGSPVVAHVLSNYYIGNLEPNTNYYTFCVAENAKQIPMSTSFQSTEHFITTLVEPPYISYLGNRISYSSIEIDALTNVRANVWNHTVIRDEDYVYPSIQTVKMSVPRQVPRQQQFTLVWNSLKNATEYAISLYSEDLKNNATEQSIPSTTFFIMTDIVRCPPFDGWNETAAGSFGLLPCNTGYSGSFKRYCDYEGAWGEIVNECERNQCPLSSGWQPTLSLTEVTMECGSGFTGTMTRYCNAEGVWLAPDRSSCVLLYCPAVNEWPRTPALTTYSIYCGTGFFGEKSRYCNGEGEWEEVVEEACVPKEICPAEEGWASTYEGEYMVQACPAGYQGTKSRYCGLGGSWSTVYDNCTQLYCPEEGMWPETVANTTTNYACPVGETGMITRFCSLEGVWQAMNTSECVQLFCNEEGIWNRTLAGLTIPGPCHEGEFGASSRTCGYNGVWESINYSECYEQGCADDDGWQAVPIGLTLRRDCPPGYGGYRYRHCASNGVWDAVNDEDCERLVCAEMNGFPTTLSGVDVNVSCGEHYSGNMTATCSLYGQWTHIDISDCTAIPTCEEEGIWPRTNMDSYRVLPCGAGIAGTQRRFCSSDLVWSAVDDSQCVQLYCDAEGTWSQTVAGIVAYQDCPGGAFGFVQRPCSVEGEWGAVDDSYCFDVWCSTYQGWPTTGGGQTATLPCSAGFTGNQTRPCSITGEWGVIDDSSCVVTTCPADGVWPETVHSTTRVEQSCPLGYYGTMFRDCSLEGSWEPVDDSMCIRKSCLPDGTWPLTLSLTTVSQSCPPGYEGAIERTCGDGVWGETEYNCSQMMCPEEDGWSTAAGTSQTRDCPYGTTGSMSRVCKLDGVWNDVDDSACEAIICPAFDHWEEGHVDDVQVKACSDGGFALLTCTLSGEWEGDPTQCYLNLCPADGKWPISAPGTIHRNTCPDGMEGYSTRYCSATGEWFEENTSQCVLTVCEADGNWPATPRNSWATIGCPSHATGLRTRYCNALSQWLAPDESGCVNHSCAADGEWPLTVIGESVVLTCGVGKRGYRSRLCGAGGIWEEENVSSCSQIVCYEEGGWPTTNALETAQLGCPEGWVGVQNRTCSAGGIWGDVENFCRERSCASEGSWPETVINTSATIACPTGYAGTYSRSCSSEGIWNEADMSTCSRLHCAADGLWVTTNTFEYATLPCGGDLLGEIRRYCNEDQTWSEPDSSQCRPNYCVGDNDWPNTPMNTTVTLPCGDGYRGMKSRFCKTDAFWDSIQDETCLQIPSMLVLTSLPNAHFILFYAQFDINAHLYLYPRSSGSTAPSVEDVISKGTNKTCEAQGVCKVYLTHLTPETQYDVYYWYQSEQGAEPSTSIASMKRIVSTLAIQPFNLTLHGVESEMNFITVAVSIEDRSGYVWCMATRSPTVPSIPQLKSTTPVFFREDNGILYKLIPDLEEDTVYHGYCYAEDIYEVPSSTSIAATHFTLSTRSDEVEVLFSLENTPTESTVTAVSNRDGTLCCDYRQDGVSPTFEEVMEADSCTDIVAYANNTLSTVVEDDTDYQVFCAVNTTTFVHYYNPESVIAIHTPSLNPTYSLVATMSAYNMMGLTFLADRSSLLYCVASTVSTQPSVEAMKQGSSQQFIGGVMNELLLLSLEKETVYHVFCYGETTEGLPMVNSLSNMTFTITTLTLPPTLSVLSSSIQFDRIRLMLSTTVPASVRCIALPSNHTTPTQTDFSEAEEQEVTVLGEYTIAGLVENTHYSAYCYGEDVHGQPMLNTIASTRTDFTTVLDQHSLFTSFVSQSELTAHISVVSSADCYVWCTVKHVNDIYLSPSLLKQEVASVQIEKETPTTITFRELTPAYQYQAYCYSESLRNISMVTSVASTAVNFTTPSYPVITVTASPLSENPSSSSIELDILSSQKGTIFCRPREVLENELPPSAEWIREGSSLSILQASITHYFTIRSLQPLTNYTLFCLGRSEENYESIQVLSGRSLNFMTLQDTTRPSVLITSSITGYTIPSQPYPVNITFTEPILDFQQSSLVLTNCRVLTWNQVSNQLYMVTFAPIVHGEFSIRVPAGSVKDLHNNENLEVVDTHYYEPKNLYIAVEEIGKLFVKGSVTYGYPASVSCIHTVSSQAPATCAVLKLDPSVTTFDNTVSTEVTFTNVSVNSTSYLYCCAEEANDVTMNNSIQSTQAVVEVGWFDCPVVNDRVCNNQGTCTDGTHCVCSTGYYGLNCTATCPGILSDLSMNYECSNHGTCNSETLECSCSSSEYGGRDCSLLELEGETPATGYSFLYVYMNVQVSNPSVSSYQYSQNKEHFIRTVSSFVGVGPQDVRIQRWNVNTEVRVLAADAGNVQFVMNVKEEEAGSKLEKMKSVSDLKEQLATESFDVTSVTVTKSYSTGSSNTDPYTCYDGELSSGEADVDCGGSCLAKCEKNQRCFVNEDCKTGYCENNMCMSNLGGGMIVVIVLVCLFVIGFICLMVVLNHHQKNQKIAVKTEIEMTRIRKQQEMRDLEKQDKIEEEELKKLEEEMKQKMEERKKKESQLETIPEEKEESKEVEKRDGESKEIENTESKEMEKEESKDKETENTNKPLPEESTEKVEQSETPNA